MSEHGCHALDLLTMSFLGSFMVTMSPPAISPSFHTQLFSSFLLYLGRFHLPFHLFSRFNEFCPPHPCDMIFFDISLSWALELASAFKDFCTSPPFLRNKGLSAVLS